MMTLRLTYRLGDPDLILVFHYKLMSHKSILGDSKTSSFNLSQRWEEGICHCHFHVKFKNARPAPSSGHRPGTKTGHWPDNTRQKHPPWVTNRLLSPAPARSQLFGSYPFPTRPNGHRAGRRESGQGPGTSRVAVSGQGPGTSRVAVSGQEAGRNGVENNLLKQCSAI